MKRPDFVHFMSLGNGKHIHIRASISLLPSSDESGAHEEIRSPLQGLSLLRFHRFSLKVVGFSTKHKNIFERIYESDAYGNFHIKIPQFIEGTMITALQLYEVSYHPGLEIMLGTKIPQILEAPKKIIISDLDKTLVDTQYANTKEVYHSLTKPLGHFPKLDKGLDIFSSHIHDGYLPFVVSASPHFYENAIRDWLYQHKIYTAKIFLKDYRQFFSIIDGVLSFKDIKTHGLYKLNHMLDILLMTGVPDEVALMGDNFETDPAIYLTLAKILEARTEPRSLWRKVEHHDMFKLTRKQNSTFLNKLYQINNMMKKAPDGHKIKIKIHIRKTRHQDFPELSLPFLRSYEHLICYYEEVDLKNQEIK